MVRGGCSSKKQYSSCASDSKVARRPGRALRKTRTQGLATAGARRLNPRCSASQRMTSFSVQTPQSCRSSQVHRAHPQPPKRQDLGYLPLRGSGRTNPAMGSTTRVAQAKESPGTSWISAVRLERAEDLRRARHRQREGRELTGKREGRVWQSSGALWTGARTAVPGTR